ncbi:MAG: glycosyltransferase family 2 protein [Piscinibacter sp.]|uniref:glycosyltransferase n=1 Tax=Piscinibacter sp. TaxID=1903157 RepID=UPI003D0D8378
MILASVIIPTRDRADVLARCLQSLERQTAAADAFEVIVVDNGSRDHTRQTALAFESRLRLRYLHAPEPGLHVGRHAGWKAARADLLVFCDDDIEAEPSWVGGVIDAFADPRVGLVGGNCHPNFEAEPPPWLARWWNEPVGAGRALGYLSVLDFGHGRFDIDPSFVWGCNFSVRRAVLDAVGGFHPDGMPKDLMRFRGDGESHVARAVRDQGWRTLFSSEASVHHQVSAGRMTPAYFEQRAFAQGVSDSYSAVRRCAGMPLPLAERLLQALRPTARTLRERWRARATASDVVGAELLKVRLGTVRAWREGFNYHQSQLRTDRHLLEWVLKESYLT